MAKIKDRKITVSLAADLADVIDERVRHAAGNTNRSKIFEEALRAWESLHQHGEVSVVLERALVLYEQEQERELYRAYYADLGDAAKNEAAGWRQIGAESASINYQRLLNSTENVALKTSSRKTKKR
ncbi:MAG: ribbon-helix-helix protein, CopG family [Cyanobacteria bacterium REEB67]|nr:ribbon-helix-helix protein, CopG family [Cyanobacteria bacterium REEB67]